MLLTERIEGERRLDILVQLLDILPDLEETDIGVYSSRMLSCEKCFAIKQAERR